MSGLNWKRERNQKRERRKKYNVPLNHAVKSDEKVFIISNKTKPGSLTKTDIIGQFLKRGVSARKVKKVTLPKMPWDEK